MTDPGVANLRALASIWQTRANGLLMMRIRSGRMRAVAFSNGGLVDGSQFSALNAYVRSSEVHFTATAPLLRRGNRDALARFFLRKIRSYETDLLEDLPVHLLIADEDAQALGLHAPAKHHPATRLSDDDRAAARTLVALGLATQPPGVVLDPSANLGSRSLSRDPVKVYMGPPPVRRSTVQA